MEAPRRGLTPGQVMRVVNRWIGVNGGYLGDFSYPSHYDFYLEYCDIDDINPNEIEGTTRQRFIHILTTQPPERQAVILRGVVRRFPVGRENAPESRTQEFAEEIERWARSLEGQAVADHAPAFSSDVVRRALDDTEVLLRQSGPTSAVDRVHTALHGYLIALCRSQNIEFAPDAANTALFKRLRTEHPALRDLGARSQDVDRILNSFAAVLDALNPMRNRGSVAHPNDDLLGPAEAMLAVNAARTVLTYLDQRLSNLSS